MEDLPDWPDDTERWWEDQDEAAEQALNEWRNDERPE